jgi:hypothetical protein
MIGHGHLNMFYSKRNLIKNFKTKYDLNDDLHLDYDLKSLKKIDKMKLFDSRR